MFQWTVKYFRFPTLTLCPVDTLLACNYKKKKKNRVLTKTNLKILRIVINNCTTNNILSMRKGVD